MPHLTAVTAPAGAILGGLRGSALGIADLTTGRSSKTAVRRLREDGRGGLVDSATTADGVRLHLEVDGPRDAPLTVVFVHGFSLDVTNWRAQRPTLATEPLRCVYYDQRGFGRSARGSLPASMRLLAADAACVIEQQSTGPVVLVGHSMGVMVIAALAGIHPELFGERIVGTVLVAGNASEITATDFGLGGVLGPLLQLVGLSGLQALGHVPHVERALSFGTYLAIAGMFMCDRTASEETLRACAAMVSQNSVQRLAEFGEAMYALDETAALPVLGRVPTTVIAADHDRFIPASLTLALAQGIPGADLRVVADSGHMIPLEHPGVVTEAILAMAARVAG